MSDYISRVQAIEEINKYRMTSGVSNQGTWNECVDVIAHTVSELPSADVRPNMHGVWIHYNDEFYSPDRFTPVLRHIVECSVCHHKIADFHGLMNFCTNCGADMRGET